MASPPYWLAEMADLVASEIQGVDLLSPIGCHYFFDDADDRWEVALFAAGTETVGGAHDGTVTPSKFTVDLINIADIFSEISKLNWQAQPLDGTDELGPHLSVEGTYAGADVWLRILAQPPKRFQNGRFARAYEMRLDEAW